MKELLKEMKDVKKRLIRIEKAVEAEILTREDLLEIRRSEAEIKAGKYKTLEQAKKELDTDEGFSGNNA